MDNREQLRVIGLALITASILMSILLIAML